MYMYQSPRTLTTTLSTLPPCTCHLVPSPPHYPHSLPVPVTSYPHHHTIHTPSLYLSPRTLTTTLSTLPPCTCHLVPSPPHYPHSLPVPVTSYPHHHTIHTPSLDVTVAFSQPSYTVNEGNPFALLEITKSGVSQQEISINIVLQQQTAQGIWGLTLS